MIHYNNTTMIHYFGRHFNNNKNNYVYFATTNDVVVPNLYMYMYIYMYILTSTHISWQS